MDQEFCYLATTTKQWQGINELISWQKTKQKAIFALKCPRSNKLSNDPTEFPNTFNKSFSSDGQSLSSKMLQAIHSDTEYLPRLSNPGSFFSFLIFFFSDDPRNLLYTQSFRCHCPYKWKNASHYFPCLIFCRQCMVFFSGDIFLTFMDLSFSRQIPFLVFERVSTKTKNRVSFWALRFREKSSLVFCPTFSRKGCIPFS